MAPALAPLQLPLRPLFVSFTVAASGEPRWSDAWAPLLLAASIVALIALAQARCARRDLVLR